MTEPGSGSESMDEGGGLPLSELVTRSPVALLIVGADRRLALATPSARAVLGLSEQDVGRPFSELAIARAIDALGARAAAAFEGRVMMALGELSWREPAGSSTRLAVDVVPLAGEPGSLDGVIIILTDAKRAHRLQVEVERAHHELRTAYAELRSTTEELTATVEELKTTNEELRETVRGLEVTAGEGTDHA